MRVARALLALLATLATGPAARAQEMVAEPVGKAPPGDVPGGIQVEVYNRTAELQQLRVRAPGGNWFLLDFPPHGGRNLRCAGCRSHVEAALPDDEDAAFTLSPGREYEIRRTRGGAVQVQPRGRASQ